MSHILCPHCDSQLVGDPQLATQTCKCPMCGGDFIMPFIATRVPNPKPKRQPYQPPPPNYSGTILVLGGICLILLLLVLVAIVLNKSPSDPPIATTQSPNTPDKSSNESPVDFADLDADSVVPTNIQWRNVLGDESCRNIERMFKHGNGNDWNTLTEAERASAAFAICAELRLLVRDAVWLTDALNTFYDPTSDNYQSVRNLSFVETAALLIGARIKSR